MTGKHGKFSKLRNLSPRAAGALAGIAVLGVVGGVAQVSLDSGSAGSVAAVQTLPSEQAGKRADRSSEPRAKTGKSDRTDRTNRTDRRDAGAGERTRDTGERASRERRAEKPEPADRRSEVIERARTWNPHTSDRVPYSQVRTHEGYRADCSGFVSMALGLPAPGENTVGLTSSRFTERISMSELKKGDLVMDASGTNTTRHVVIFEKWANSDHTAYWAYEQRGRYGTDHRTRDYGLSSGSEYKAYRPTNL